MNDKKRIMNAIKESRRKCLKTKKELTKKINSANQFLLELNYLEQLIKNIEKIIKVIESGNRPEGRISQDDEYAENYEIKYVTLKELDAILKRKKNGYTCLNLDDKYFRRKRNKRKYINIFEIQDGNTAVFYITIRKYYF